KAGAVRLVREEGRTITSVARELDLTHSALCSWVKQAEVDEGKGRPGALTSDEKAELTELRRKVRQLEMEKEILKKQSRSRPRPVGRKTPRGRSGVTWTERPSAFWRRR